MFWVSLLITAQHSRLYRRMVFHILIKTTLLTFLSLKTLPHHSPHLQSHHLSLPRPVTSHSTLLFICFTNIIPPQSFWFHLDCLHGTRTRARLTGHWCLFLLPFIYFLFLVFCARLSCHTQLFSLC